MRHSYWNKVITNATGLTRTSLCYVIMYSVKKKGPQHFRTSSRALKCLLLCCGFPQQEQTIKPAASLKFLWRNRWSSRGVTEFTQFWKVTMGIFWQNKVDCARSSFLSKPRVRFFPQATNCIPLWWNRMSITIHLIYFCVCAFFNCTNLVLLLILIF